MTFAWSINLLTTMPFQVEQAEDLLIAFEIIGVPTHKPLVGDTYSLALIFERTEIEDTQPLVDAVWVNWEIGNGPRALVSVVDTYSDTGKTGADLMPSDPIANNWHVEDWTEVQPFTCQKLQSEGCDVLTAKIYKYWFEYNSMEDISLQDGTFLISLYTKRCGDGDQDCVTEQYNKESAWFFDISMTAGAQSLLAGIMIILPYVILYL